MKTLHCLPEWKNARQWNDHPPRINRSYIDCYGRKLRVIEVSPESAVVVVRFENRHCQDIDEALWRELGPIDVERIAASDGR